MSSNYALTQYKSGSKLSPDKIIELYKLAKKEKNSELMRLVETFTVKETIKKSELKQIIKEIVKGVFKEMTATSAASPISTPFAFKRRKIKEENFPKTTDDAIKIWGDQLKQLNDKLLNTFGLVVKVDRSKDANFIRTPSGKRMHDLTALMVYDSNGNRIDAGNGSFISKNGPSMDAQDMIYNIWTLRNKLHDFLLDKGITGGLWEKLDENKVNNISPDTPYGVIDTQTKEIVYRTTYKNRNAARRFADKKDNEYGAYKYKACILKDVNEQTVTGNVSGYNVPMAFSRRGGSERGVQGSNSLGYELTPIGKKEMARHGDNL